MTSRIKKMNTENKLGFTLLYASIVAGLLLAVGIAILDVELKEIELSSAGSQSQFAFYNADTGTECAMYLDRLSRTVGDCPEGLFPASGNNTNGTDCTNQTYYNNFSCLGINFTANSPVNFQYSQNANAAATSTYSFSIATSTNDTCFDITINKTGSPETTQIISRGYNTCNVNSTNRFERAIEIDF